jgi:hypothetical protein
MARSMSSARSAAAALPITLAASAFFVAVAAAAPPTATGSAADPAAYKPCHMPYTAFTRDIESPCFATKGSLGSGVTVRSYTAAADNGATLVSSNESSALQPWDNGLEITANHMFEYFEGPGNAGGVNLTASLTAPLMFRPASDTRSWFVDMVLKPSAWPAKSHPPRPARGFVALVPFGPLQVAVLHRAVKVPPAQADFEACDAALRTVVSSSSSWTVDAARPHTPTFAFYFPRDDGLIPTSGPYDFECWVEVDAK